MGRLRRAFEDMGPFVVWAALLFVVGSLFVGATIQSPTALQWTGTAVHAVESGGISYYSFHGQNYTLDVTSPWVQPDTVYLDPADPSTAMLGNPVVRWAEFASVAGPYAASVLLLTAGFARRSRRRRLAHAHPDVGYGTGLDRSTLRRLRDRQRSGTDGSEDHPGDGVGP